MESVTQSLEVSSRAYFLGRKGNPQMADLMQRCEIFVLPSRTEPFGIVVIEAMTCKKPVVATRVGEVPEIIEDGKTGVLVEPDNPEALAAALSGLIRDRD